MNHSTALLASAERIAQHLPDWTAGPWNNEAQLTHPDGRAILVHFANYRDTSRLVLHGVYPRLGHRYVSPRGTFANEISVASTRTPEAIAKEITRRLLPSYTEGFRDVQTQIVERGVSAAGRKATAARLAELLETQFTDRDEEEITLYPRNTPGLHRVRVLGADLVRFEDFSCDAVTAEKVLAAVRP